MLSMKSLSLPTSHRVDRRDQLTSAWRTAWTKLGVSPTGATPLLLRSTGTPARSLVRQRTVSGGFELVYGRAWVWVRASGTEPVTGCVAGVAGCVRYGSGQ